MSKSLIGILHKSTLKIYISLGKDKFEEISLDFPEAVVKKSDIFDLEKFSYDLKNQLIKRPDLKGSEILFLVPDEKIFSKKINLQTADLESEIASFYTQIPFTEEETLLNVYQNGSFATLVAVPRKLLNNLDLCLSKIGFKTSFIPLSQILGLGFGSKNIQMVGFDLDGHYNLIVCHNNQFLLAQEVDTDKLDPANISQAILNQINTFKQDSDLQNLVGIILLDNNPDLKSTLESNGVKVGAIPVEEGINKTLTKIAREVSGNIPRYLLTEKTASKKTGSLASTPPRKIYFPIKKILSMVGIFVFLAFLVGTFYFFMQLGSKPNSITDATPTPIASVSAIPVATASSTPTATPTLVAKSSLTVLVLNGNGLPGDAGRVQKIIQGLGYDQVTTDTAGSQNRRSTELLFDSTVPQTYKDEIKAEIEKEYLNVIIGETSPSGISIQITLGPKQ